MTTLQNAFEFHERGLKDVMEDTMEGYRYQTLHDSQHGSRVSNTFTPSGINSAERKFIRSHDRGSVLILHLAKVRMSFKIVKNNAAYGYADLINTDHVTLSSDAKTMFSRRELRIGGKTVEDIDNMAVRKSSRYSHELFLGVRKDCWIESIYLPTSHLVSRGHLLWHSPRLTIVQL